MPVVTKDDLQLYDPTLDDTEATRLAQLADDAVAAFLEPVEVPAPVPKRMRMVAIAQAFRLKRSTTTAGGVVSESLGSYSYRLDRPLGIDRALFLDDDLATELLPWALHRAKVYDVSVALDDAVRPAWWPVDWWQRDLDNVDDAPSSLAELPDPPPISGWSR